MFIHIDGGIIGWSHPLWQRASAYTSRGVMGLCAGYCTLRG
jgi:hypothetical protein